MNSWLIHKPADWLHAWMDEWLNKLARWLGYRLTDCMHRTNCRAEHSTAWKKSSWDKKICQIFFSFFFFFHFKCPFPVRLYLNEPKIITRGNASNLLVGHYTKIVPGEWHDGTTSLLPWLTGLTECLDWPCFCLTKAAAGCLIDCLEDWLGGLIDWHLIAQPNWWMDV